MSEFRDMKDAYDRAKQEVREIEDAMAQYAIDYHGTVKEAVQEGIVKFNFPVPKGWILEHYMA